ncbi:MAG: peptidase S58 family protein, partial [Thermodesulfobacteriota bacterium]|nr:peptidase S58 family protein [Thermodesulfobacteriota bacterium]
NAIWATLVAQMAFNGFVKTISPVHSLFDGDLIFVLSMGSLEVDINILGLLSEEVVIKSVKRAVIQADGFGKIPAYRDL